ncbi:hypothetical protein PPL19_02070 [Pseudomonas psychrotolerans L19]|nr:hypothetical protein PPL19_02070 [Pseudomonas psychrotolerans L19]
MRRIMLVLCAEAELRNFELNHELVDSQPKFYSYLAQQRALTA